MAGILQRTQEDRLLNLWLWRRTANMFSVAIDFKNSSNFRINLGAAAVHLTNEQIAELRGSFDLFDKNGDGKISSSELRTVMKALGHNPTLAEVKDIIAGVDSNENGSIDFPEYLTVMSKYYTTGSENEADILAAFKVFDLDGDGFITADEIRQASQRFGEETTDEEIDAMIQEADLNNDGKIDYEEFHKLMLDK
ncbi:uncharacterized protein LOC144442728 [Glandiceps talaboti]